MATDAPTDSFGTLAKIVAGQWSPADHTFDDPAFERLRCAVLEPQGRSPLDLALLVRHALMRENGRRGLGREDALLRLKDGIGWLQPAPWASVGCQAVAQSGLLHVRARGWRPDWMPGCTQEAVDAMASRAERRRLGLQTRSLPSDPFLELVGHTHYRSVGQCRAARALLTAPPGATLLVALPTGEGKSVLFHLADRVGFGPTPRPADAPGVVLVVVPTITLALDHEKSTQRRAGDNRPRAYVGDDRRKEAIREAVRAGTQGLIFAAPEAACTGLRAALRAAAQSGALTTLVVDEAHLVDGWGTDFRTDFQMLSGLWAELREVATAPGGLRTLLLSATLTQRSVDTLRALFSTPSAKFGFAGATALRPEIVYWIGPLADAATRHARCVEALHHLPRPRPGAHYRRRRHVGAPRGVAGGIPGRQPHQGRAPTTRAARSDGPGAGALMRPLAGPAPRPRSPPASSSVLAAPGSTALPVRALLVR